MSTETGVMHACRCLAQAIASGRLHKEDARVVAEELPNVMQAIAIQINGTIGQALREAAGDDGIPSHIVVNAILMLELRMEPQTLPEASVRFRAAFSRLAWLLIPGWLKRMALAR